jgi:hypothetical protein
MRIVLNVTSLPGPESAGIFDQLLRALAVAYASLNLEDRWLRPHSSPQQMPAVRSKNG